MPLELDGISGKQRCEDRRRRLDRMAASSRRSRIALEVLQAQFDIEDALLAVQSVLAASDGDEAKLSQLQAVLAHLRAAILCCEQAADVLEDVDHQLGPHSERTEASKLIVSQPADRVSMKEFVTEKSEGYVPDTSPSKSAVEESCHTLEYRYTPSTASKISVEVKQQTIRADDEKPFCCSLCERSFAKALGLEVHMKLHAVKTDEKGQLEKNSAFSCSVCNKSFVRLERLDIHMRIHTGEKPFSCLDCRKSFKQSSHLQTHMRIHTGERPFSCSICTRSFAILQNLQTHLRVHTGEKPYICSKCARSFASAGKLKLHERDHTGDGPYRCSDCNKAFSQSHRLNVHRRLHTGEKPFLCSECEKAFTQLGHLQAHARIHSGEKPYSCLECSKSFSLRHNLKKHSKVHAGDVQSKKEPIAEKE